MAQNVSTSAQHSIIIDVIPSFIFHLQEELYLRVSYSIAWFPLPTLMSPPLPLKSAQFALENLSTSLKQLSEGNDNDLSIACFLAQ